MQVENVEETEQKEVPRGGDKNIFRRTQESRLASSKARTHLRQRSREREIGFITLKM